ncbi:MAG TPA: hypothetical protein DC042_12705 [Bacteroidales bacterium]|nr:hypothetical protein [Bacteroidales bacterium]
MNRILLIMCVCMASLQSYSQKNIQAAAPDAGKPIIPQEIEGNWYRTDGSGEWVYGFHNPVVIWNSQVHDSVLVKKSGRKYEISLLDLGAPRTIRTKPASGGNLLISAEPGKFELFSRESQIKSDFVIPDDQEFRSTIFKRDTAIIIGYLKGYRPVKGQSTVIRTQEVLDFLEKITKFQVESDGKFEIRIPVYYPHEIQLYIKGLYRNVFIEPGKKTFVFLDLTDRETSKKVPAFMGDNARINSDLQYIGKPHLFQYLDMVGNADKMNWNEYKDWGLAQLQKGLDSLQRTASRTPVCKKAIQVRRLGMACETYGLILQYDMYQNVGADLKKSPEPGRPEIPGKDFYSFLSPDLLASPAGPVAGEAYCEFISEIDFHASDYLGNKERPQYFLESMGLPRGITLDYLLYQYYSFQLKGNMQPFSKVERDSVEMLIGTSFLRDSLITESDRIGQENQARAIENKAKTGYFIPDLPAFSGDSLFEVIISQYPGKVIFMDFWATWCSPCKAGIQRMKPLKEEYSGKDIVFVYITNTSSPPDTWDLYIPDVKGYHYRLTAEQTKHLYKRFDIKTIPRYMLIGKTGKLVNDNLGTGAHTNEELRKLFDEELKK